MTKSELIQYLNNPNVDENEEILVSIRKKNELSSDKDTSRIFPIDFVGGPFVFVTDRGED